MVDRSRVVVRCEVCGECQVLSYHQYAIKGSRAQELTPERLRVMGWSRVPYYINKTSTVHLVQSMFALESILEVSAKVGMPVPLYERTMIALRRELARRKNAQCMMLNYLCEGIPHLVHLRCYLTEGKNVG